jgi:hypothetical protein
VTRLAALEAVRRISGAVYRNRLAGDLTGAAGLFATTGALAARTAAYAFAFQPTFAELPRFVNTLIDRHRQAA